MIRVTVLFPVLIFLSGKISGQAGFSFRDIAGERKLELVYDGKLLTAYLYSDSVEKPVLFPIRTVRGTTITRGWPISPRAGERTDHPHHVGLWFNYESVNGLDFWNNSYAIPPEKKHLYGSIRHQQIISKEASASGASLTTFSHWVDHEGNVLLTETTEFSFRVKGESFIIDRESKLIAMTDVSFKDVKDGMLGLRVARELEMPSTQEDRFVDSKGNVTEVPASNSTGVTGMYVNREGVTGDACWGKRSVWTYLKGEKDGEKIMIIMIDHQANPGYPTYWHARGYGLFAANPLGQEVFSGGKETLAFRLARGAGAQFKHRIIIHSGTELTRKQIDDLMVEFNKKAN